MYRLYNPVDFPVNFVIHNGVIPNAVLKISRLEVEPRFARGWKRYKKYLCKLRGHHTWVYAQLVSDKYGILFSNAICKCCGKVEQ